MNVVQLVFLLLALLYVLSCLFPGWNWPMQVSPPVFVRIVIGLLVIFILYLIVVALFGAGPVVRA